MALSSERYAEEMSQKFSGLGIYHRLDVPLGLEDIKLADFELLGSVQTHTRSYLQRSDVRREVDQIAIALLGRPTEPAQPRITIGLLCKGTLDALERS